jgi:cytochrome c biogenesis protein CcmG, thiol:disulfide interchange protein DsbE
MKRRLIAWGLLAVAHAGRAEAEPAVTSFFKPLDLVGYASRTTAPHFSGGTADTRQVSLKDLRGQVVVLNFWASWCLECRPEMPVLERLHREFAPQGLAVIGINAREERAAVRRYAQELGLTFPLVLDADGSINALYGVVGVPTTFIVDRDGRAVAFAVGPREWAGPPARSLIRALLAEPVPRSGAP